MDVTLNIAIVTFVCGAISACARRSPMRVVMRYFTAQSNVLCAAAAAIVVACQLAGNLPVWAVYVKYAATVSVTITMLTVLLFLGPVNGYKPFITGPDFFLHLLCPVLALVSYLGFEKTSMPFWAVLIGMAPMALYAVLYCHKVIFAPEDKRWNDFYGFDRGGRWRLSYVLMLLAAFVVSLILWAV